MLRPIIKLSVMPVREKVLKVMKNKINLKRKKYTWGEGKEDIVDLNDVWFSHFYRHDWLQEQFSMQSPLLVDPNWLPMRVPQWFQTATR